MWLCQKKTDTYASPPLTPSEHVTLPPVRLSENGVIAGKGRFNAQPIEIAASLDNAAIGELVDNKRFRSQPPTDDIHLVVDSN